MQFDPARLGTSENALLAEIPGSVIGAWRRITAGPPPWALSPFRGVSFERDTPRLVHDRFRRRARASHRSRCIPLAMVVDLDAIQRDDPALLERVLGVEAAGARRCDVWRPGVVLRGVSPACRSFPIDFQAPSAVSRPLHAAVDRFRGLARSGGFWSSPCAARSRGPVACSGHGPRSSGTMSRCGTSCRGTSRRGRRGAALGR